MQRSRDQMRAIHARYAQAKGDLRQFERKHFPVHGSRTRARINRALLATAGVGATAATLTVATGAGRRTGPFRAMFGLSGERHIFRDGMTPDQPRPGWRGSQYRTGTFLSGSRQATPLEAKLLDASRRFGGPWTRGLRRWMGADSSRPARGAGRIWTVSGVPLDARVGAALRAVRNRRLEQASIWNSLGRGGLYEFITNSSARGQDWSRRAAQGFVDNVAAKVDRPIGRAYARAVKIPLWRANRAAVRHVHRLGHWLIRSAA